MHKLKILINVQGRFHAFDLAKAFTQRADCEVHLATNYPRSVVTDRFDCHPARIYTNVTHGVLSRAANYLGPWVNSICEAKLHQGFGKFALKCAESDNYDLVHSFSGVAEEVLRYRIVECVNTVVRGSAHIVEQARLLNEESHRLGWKIETPSEWMIEREQREYDLADKIVVLSSFAYQSFIRMGFPADRLRLIPLGVNIGHFKATTEDRERRAERIRSGKPLRVIFTGTFSAQKGAIDFCEVADRLKGRVEFTVVGNVTQDAKPILQKSGHSIRFLPRVLPTELRQYYMDNDLFLFTTIQDGFAAVLAQAFAAGMGIVSTENCGVSDIAGNSPLAWIVPIRSPEAIVDRIKWIDDNRDTVASLVAEQSGQYIREWSHVADDLVTLVHELHKNLGKHSALNPLNKLAGS